jgi:ABC-type polysaccharide/polyol phosphate export permease
MAESNKPVNSVYSMCTDAAYRLYGSSNSSKLDMNRYQAEVAKCSEAFVRDVISLPAIFGAMIGTGNWNLGLVAWGFILIPLALLWIIAWGIGRVVHWVAAGFRR